MALPASGQIGLNDVQTEFGGSNPISLSEYYSAAAGVPASGQISLSNFYGTASGDVTPNAVNWANVSGTYQEFNATQTISGITVPISISWTDTSLYVTVEASKNGGAYASSPVTVSNGDTLRFRCTNTDFLSQSGTVTVKNATDGNVTLDTFTFSLAGAP